MLRTSRAAVLLAAAASASLCLAAGSVGGTFGVNITLLPPGSTVPGSAQAAASSGICRSESLSEQTGALVRVVCQSGQFVSIAPRPGGRFIATHGGAYSFSFGSLLGSVEHSAGGIIASGAGTIASFRVFSIEANDGPIDMLVSF